MYKNHNCEVVLAGVNPDPDNLQDGIYGTDDKDILLKYYPSYKLLDGVYMQFLSHFLMAKHT